MLKRYQKKKNIRRKVETINNACDAYDRQVEQDIKFINSLYNCNKFIFGEALLADCRRPHPYSNQIIEMYSKYGLENISKPSDIEKIEYDFNKRQIILKPRNI